MNQKKRIFRILPPLPAGHPGLYPGRLRKPERRHVRCFFLRQQLR